MDGIDKDFTNALCPDDLDRVTDVLEGVFARMPTLMDVGIRSIVNGPITYTIDGAPLVGPIPGKRNAFCIIGLRAGLGEGGGHGWLLAQQIVHGEAELDTWVIDPRRFGSHATTELCALKAIEDYQNEFRFHYPHEHRPAGRPMKTTALTPVLAAAGAEFSVVDGWERLDYIKPDEQFHESHGFRFNESFDVVAAEVALVRDKVGLTEVNGFNRIEIQGKNVHAWLDTLVCGSVPKRHGRVGLAYLLNQHGNIKAEATLANVAEDTLWYGSAAASERHDMDWLNMHLPSDGSITLTSLTQSWTTLVLAGPDSRKVLSAASRGDWSAEAFPWLSVRHACIGIVPAVVWSVSFSGELAYELHVPSSQLQSAYEAVRKAGEKFDLQLFGARAVDSMRIEKGFRHWKSDLVTEFDPYESSLDRFVKADKPEFIGKQALAAKLAEGLTRRFVTLHIDCDHAPAQPGDSIVCDGRVVGTVTSADWGHRVNRNLAMGFVEPAMADVGQALQVDVIGEPMPATVTEHCVYDASYSRMRS